MRSNSPTRFELASHVCALTSESVGHAACTPAHIAREPRFTWGKLCAAGDATCEDSICHEKARRARTITTGEMPAQTASVQVGGRIEVVVENEIGRRALASPTHRPTRARALRRTGEGQLSSLTQ